VSRIVLLFVVGLLALLYFRMQSPPETDSSPASPASQASQAQTWGEKMTQAYKTCTATYGDEKARNKAQIDCDRGCVGKTGDDAFRCMTACRKQSEQFGACLSKNAPPPTR
jgi:Tfp pilus assembly protein PilV